MILKSRCKQNLSPGVAVMLSSPSAVRQVDGIDDSWEAKCEPGEDQLTEEKCVSNICLNSNHIAPSFPPRIVEGIAAISALVFKPGKDLSNHTLVDCDLHVFFANVFETHFTRFRLWRIYSCHAVCHFFLTLFEPESRCGDTVVSHLNLKHSHFHLFGQYFFEQGNPWYV